MFEDIRENPAAKRSRLKVTLQAITIALFILAIVYFLRKYSADISNLKMLSALDIVVIGAWSFISYTAYAYAVYIVFLDLGLKKLGPIAWLRIYFVSRLVNFFITQGGNLYRLLVLKKNYNFSYTNTVGVTGFLIWINAAIALLASVYALNGLELDFQVGGLSLVWWCAYLLVGLMVVPLLAILLADRSRMASIAECKLAAPFLQVAEFFTSTIKNIRLFAIVTTLSVIHFCFFLGVNYFGFRAIGQQIDLGIVCVFTTAFVFTRYINVVPGNIGVSELVGGLMSEQMGVGFSNGLIVTGIVRMVEVLVILLTGLIYGKILAVAFFRRG